MIGAARVEHEERKANREGELAHAVDLPWADAVDKLAVKRDERVGRQHCHRGHQSILQHLLVAALAATALGGTSRLLSSGAAIDENALGIEHGVQRRHSEDDTAGHENGYACECENSGAARKARCVLPHQPVRWQQSFVGEWLRHIRHVLVWLIAFASHDGCPRLESGQRARGQCARDDAALREFRAQH